MEETKNLEELNKMAFAITGNYMDANDLLESLQEIKDGYMMAYINVDNDDDGGIGFPDKETMKNHICVLNTMIYILSGKHKN